MGEAAILFKLLHASILDIFKVLEYIDRLSIGIWYQPYSVIPTLPGSDLVIWVTCGGKMMSLGHG